MDTSPTSLGPLVGLYPFNAVKGHGSVVIFRLTTTPDAPTEESYFRVHMCSWGICESGKRLAHSESGDDEITSAVALLNGRKLEEIVLHTYITPLKVLHGASLIFEGRLQMRLYQYEDGLPDEKLFCTQNAAKAWVAFLADGSLRTSQGAGENTANI